jgi:catechol 2,3-dioxygenase-like lactoylglutathione lyase family enzyme
MSRYRRLVRLHHLALGTRDVRKLAAFYSQAFQLEMRARHYEEDGSLRSIWLAAGDVLLMLERTSEAPRRVEGVGWGPCLIAFEIAASERPEVERRLAQLGSEVELRTEFTAYARDPEGNRIAVSHYPASGDPRPPAPRR